jgi:hypothetical protein
MHPFQQSLHELWFSDKYLHTLCTEMEMVIEYIYMSMTEFCVEWLS